MKEPFFLPVVGNKVKLLHITDTHLFAEQQGCLLGIDTNQSFCAVIDEIKQQTSDIDLIVATGDFVQDGSKEAYLRFAQKVTELSVPCVWLPGNHDVYDHMKEIFTQQNFPEKKLILIGDAWLIVMLNSQVPGKAYGILSDEELTFLYNTLTYYTNRNIVIFLHHHPIMSNCQWLDQHSLRNHEDLGALIKQHKHVKSIIWGHIHQITENSWHHCQTFSSPSTCVQFALNSDDFMVAQEQPGWRIIELAVDGSITTNVYRLSDGIFQPDTRQKGY